MCLMRTTSALLKNVPAETISVSVLVFLIFLTDTDDDDGTDSLLRSADVRSAGLWPVLRLRMTFSGLMSQWIRSMLCRRSNVRITWKAISAACGKLVCACSCEEKNCSPSRLVSGLPSIKSITRNNALSDLYLLWCVVRDVWYVIKGCGLEGVRESGEQHTMR